MSRVDHGVDHGVDRGGVEEGQGDAQEADPLLPEWLRPLASLAHSITAEQLAANFPYPPADARPAAVLICFGDGADGPELLLTERASTLRHHAGQISFPGGARDDADADAVATALREAQEEVGLDPAEVHVFGTLPTLWLPPSNFAVTPVLGYRTSSEPLRPRSPDEVHRVLQRPIRTLVDPDNRFSVKHPSGWTGPAFDVDTEVPLWGFTGGVVSRLFHHLGWEQPWDASDLRDLPEPP